MMLACMILLMASSIFGLKDGVELKSGKNSHLPSLFVLGTQKGGSSSLYEFLMLHPLLCGGDHKEAHFFDHIDFFRQGRAAYASKYTDIKCGSNSKAMFVDGTPQLHYIASSKNVAARMHDFYTPEERNKLKFIVFLREPVGRDYSWYQHVIRETLAKGTKFTDIMTIEEMDKNEESKYKYDYAFHRGGRYVEQLDRFTDYFRRDQLLVINSGVVFHNSSAVMEIISKFLGIKMIPEWYGPFPHDDHLGYIKVSVECVLRHIPALDCPFRDELGKYYEPFNTILYDWIDGTRGQAPKMEPFFPRFKNEFLQLKCVQDSRADYNEILSQDSATTCPRSHK